MLDISDILVTQNGLRNLEQLPEMIRFVGRQSGVFDEEALGSYAIRKNLERVSPKIEIARFDDGVMAVHNGHHRAVAVFLGRNNRKLYDDEFFIREWRYTDYTDIVLPYWVTPFDILKEFRIAELADWKKLVREYYKDNGAEKTEQFIMENKHQYSLSRSFYTVGDMVSKFHLYNMKGQ